MASSVSPPSKGTLIVTVCAAVYGDDDRHVLLELTQGRRRESLACHALPL